MSASQLNLNLEGKKKGYGGREGGIRGLNGNGKNTIKINFFKEKKRVMN